MSLNPNKKSTESIRAQEAIDNLAMEAAELESFQTVVQKLKEDSASMREVLIEVRELLRDTFADELAQIPEPQKGPEQVLISGLSSNELLVAKAIVNLLR